MNKDIEMFTQYVVAYKTKDGKWYRDSEKHQDITSVVKRLSELNSKGKYMECKITYRKISKWYDLGVEYR